jgi:hypothetical protein
VQVAVDALDRDRNAVERAELLLDGRHVLLDLGHRVGGRPQPGQHRVERERRGAGAERAGQVGVYRGDRLAEPVRLALEVAAHLVGGHLGVGEQVAGRGGGHGPALGGVRGVLRHHAERARLAALVGLERAEQPRHVRVAAPPEHPVELDVRVDSGGHPAEDLEDRLLAVDHAGVALLGVEDPGVRVVARIGDIRLGLERDVADRAAGGHEGEQPVRGGRVVERVVAGAVVVGADRGDRAELGDRPVVPGHDHLVPLGAAVGVLHVDQHQVEVVVELGRRRLLDRRQRAGPARVPALLRQPLGEGQRHCFSSVPHSWNQ